MFSEIKNEHAIYFKKMNGDITTGREKGKNKKTKSIQGILDKTIVDYRRNEVPWRNMSTKDFYAIIQIVDLDGAFVSEECIVDDGESKFYYTDDAILTSNVDYVVGRNRKKQRD